LGSDGGGDSAAAIYTPIGSAKLNGIEPQRYLHHVLERIADHASTTCCRGQWPGRWGPPASNVWPLDAAGAGTIMAHAHEPEDRRLAPWRRAQSCTSSAGWSSRSTGYRLSRANLASAKATRNSASAISRTSVADVWSSANLGHWGTALLLCANAVSNVSNLSAALCHAAKEGVAGILFDVIRLDMIDLY
jgi:hypothetical protein